MASTLFSAWPDVPGCIQFLSSLPFLLAGQQSYVWLAAAKDVCKRAWFPIDEHDRAASKLLYIINFTCIFALPFVFLQCCWWNVKLVLVCDGFWLTLKYVLDCGTVLTEYKYVYYQRWSFEAPNRGIFEMWIEYGGQDWQHSSSVPRGSTWAWLLPVGKWSDCLRCKPYFSPQNLSRPPTLPNHMIFGVIESL